MVRLPNPGDLRPETEVARGGKRPLSAAAVKLETEDPLAELHGPAYKISKCSASFPQWNTDAGGVLSDQPQYNPLDEPSPLGLRLRKSPSLVDLIQMRLSQGSSSKAFLTSGGGSEAGKKKDTKTSSSSVDKLKASNFPATLLRVGAWECVSRYEGDLVAKCYFAKRKLVWEVLDGGLKSKIEIQWSDIMDIKATYPDNSLGTLDIVLARQPLFFRETNPQPRKHTLWQATSDFTGGQASMHRRHFLQVPQGLLSKHFEKLIQCDPRLYSISKQPAIILNSAYFGDQDGKCHPFECTKGEFEGSCFPGFHDAHSPSGGPSSSSKSGELRDPARTPDATSHESLSPCSAMDSGMNEESTGSDIRELRSFAKWDQLKFPGIHPSMSMSDLMNHIGNCISKKMTSGSPPFPGASVTDKDLLLEDITQYLLSDSQNMAASDENSLMSRVNSLCCLLQKEPAPPPSLQMNNGRSGDDGADSKSSLDPRSTWEKKPLSDLPNPEGESSDLTAQKPLPMSRKESFGDLLLHLPRIASLPQFFFNISEDSADKAR
ncbi:unnamed protein product [Spirodela intermedia]|uniref:TRF2/HOY1 PH-like domain-containing protein n=1 Tax=Spirodela intermedia TaxID=51605 RepID=A0A7I8LHR5_SPIIN|nr:unnamed protein product [Spirodela intermedia]